MPRKPKNKTPMIVTTIALPRWVIDAYHHAAKTVGTNRSALMRARLTKGAKILNKKAREVRHG